jgi:hypothetical protein
MKYIASKNDKSKNIRGGTRQSSGAKPKYNEETITHTDKMVVIEVAINEPQIIEYLSGDY